MSDFVNYQKRGVNLPAHCKDLIDLLRSNYSGERVPRLEDFEVTRDEVLDAPLSELEIHIQAFCNFRGQFAELRIAEPDDQITVLFTKRIASVVEASISIPPVSPHQQAIRGFLSDNGLKWPKGSEFPKAIFPAIPVQFFQVITPLPINPVELSRLTNDFFVHVGLVGGSLLQYRHWMISKKG